MQTERMRRKTQSHTKWEQEAAASLIANDSGYCVDGQLDEKGNTLFSSPSDWLLTL